MQENEIVLNISQEDGWAFDTITSSIEPFIALLIVPIFLVSNWEEFWTYTFIEKEWIKILWIGIYFIIGIMTIRHLKKYFSRDLKSTINAEGIDGEKWKNIVDLKINNNNKITHIKFQTTMGTFRSYKVKTPDYEYKILSKLKEEFFSPTNKVW